VANAVRVRVSPSACLTKPPRICGGFVLAFYGGKIFGRGLVRAIAEIVKMHHMSTDKPIFFQFEADFVESLRCIPMVVRYKLDTCGIKLKLDQWNRFSDRDCQALVEHPCTTSEDIAAYRQLLSELIWHYTQTPATELPIDEHPPWIDGNSIPESVRAKAKSVETDLTLEQWQTLTLLQRFALIKLSRSSHENRNFIPALKEFNL
jgi:hypothetical protein